MKEEFPRIHITRRTEDTGGRYFGPFSSANSIRQTLKLIKGIFPLRSCTKPITGKDVRPCLDYHIGHYAKTVLDEVFGQNNFKNEIVWKRSLPHNDPRKYGAIHDVIYYYVKSENYVFNQMFTGLSEEYKDSHYSQVDEQGREGDVAALLRPGRRALRVLCQEGSTGSAAARGQ